MSTVEIQSSIPMPEEKKKRTPRKAKAETTNAASGLITALKFIKPAQAKSGTEQMQFCSISGGWVAASNGVLTIAHPIQEDLQACPHTFDLLSALNHCGQELSITQLSASSLSIKSGDFKASVNCTELPLFSIPAPDANIAVINDAIKTALACVMPLATDGDSNVICSVVMLQQNTAVATNGHTLIECWHGTDLPPGMLIPKASAAAIAKASGVLVGFGYSPNSATFYFENSAFIKTQLFDASFPYYEDKFKHEMHLQPVPKDFFEAIKTIEIFSKKGFVYFVDGYMSSHENLKEAAIYKMDGICNGLGFQIKELKLIKHVFENVEFDIEAKRAYFTNAIARGILTGVDIREKPMQLARADDNLHYGHFDDLEDDIPF